MADTAEGKIAEALYTKVSEFSASPVLPVAYPEIDFTPPADNKYLRVQFNPNRSTARIINSTPSHHMGILQITVNWPKGKGDIAPREVAGAIADHFRADLRIPVDTSHIRITHRPYVADLMPGDARSEIPVSIFWECWI